MGAALVLPCSAAQLACCCGSAACSLCSACPSCRNSTSTRIMYALMLLVGTVVGCIMLAPGLQDKLRSVPFCKSSNGYDCTNAVGYLAVYRIGFGLTIFFVLMALMMIGVRSSKDPRAGIQNGFWGIKYLLVIGFIVGAFFIPEDGGFGTTWMYFGMIGGLTFIIIQLVLIIDFAHTWAENWLDRYERTESKWWFAAMMAVTFINYALVITGVTLLFINYTTPDSCGWQKFFISVVLIMSVIVSVVSILPAVQDRQTRSGLLQSSVVSLYVVYLTWSALSNSPDPECNAGGMLSILGKGDSKVGFDKQTVISLCIWVCCVIYSSFRSASQSSKITMSEHVLVKDGGDAESGPGDKNVWDNEEDGVAYEWSFFHVTFALSTLYIMMTLTNWYSPNSSLETLNANSASMWVKVVSSWLCLSLYLWTLVAPIVLPNRVFE